MINLKTLFLLIALSALAACSSTGGSSSEPSHGYWTNSGGKVWKSGFGECWGSSSKKPDMIGEDCGPVEEPEEEIEANFIVPDGDNDGVPDHSDKCPNTPAGVEVDADGCAKDDDGDGVPNFLDKCPNTPAGVVVDENGCERLIASLQDVHFNFDSASLTSEAKSILDDVAMKIKSRGASSYIVEGHTDSTGPIDYNMGLSKRRADSVTNYLRSIGVDATLKSVGKGESYPIASNESAAGRAKNRRVDILTE